MSSQALQAHILAWGERLLRWEGDGRREVLGVRLRGLAGRRRLAWREGGRGGWELAGLGQSGGLVVAWAVTAGGREFREGHKGAGREVGCLQPLTLLDCGVKGEGQVSRGAPELLQGGSRGEIGD